MTTIKRKSYLVKSNALKNISYFMGRASAGDPSAPLIIKIFKRALAGNLKVTEEFYEAFWKPTYSFYSGSCNTHCVPLEDASIAGLDACKYFNFNNPAIIRAAIPKGEYRMTTNYMINGRNKMDVYIHEREGINLDAPDEAWHALNMFSPRELIAKQNAMVQEVKENFNSEVDRCKREHCRFKITDFIDSVAVLPSRSKLYEDSEGSYTVVDLSNYAEEKGPRELSTAVKIKDVGCKKLASFMPYTYGDVYAVYEVSMDFIHIKDRWGGYWVNPFVLED